MVNKNFKGLVIANDADNFSVGANLGFLLFAANIGAWKTIEDIIQHGQSVYMALKYSSFPVVILVTRIIKFLDGNLSFNSLNVQCLLPVCFSIK